jgi:hypothetical protein
MNTTMSRGLIRVIAGPVAAAGIIGGALGVAAVANAHTAPPSIGDGVRIGTVAHSPDYSSLAMGNGKWTYHG